MPEQRGQVRIMKEKEVQRVTGVSKVTRREMAARGEFPSPVWITRRTCGYMSDEIEDWLEKRREKRSIPTEKDSVAEGQE